MQRHFVLLFGLAVAVSACSPSTHVATTPASVKAAYASYLLELNATSPASPVLDGQDPAVKAKLVPPDLLHRVQPSPPASGRKPPAEGKAFLACVIEPDGSVSNVRVLSTSGNRDFDASSLEAVRQWRYSPPSLDGAPVRLFNHVTTSYRFH
jgi:protein TonB